MKEHKCDHCPCCGRHCHRDKLSCKHGVVYFSKPESKTVKKTAEAINPDNPAQRFMPMGAGA